MTNSNSDSDLGVQNGLERSKTRSKENSRKALAVVWVRSDSSLGQGGGGGGNGKNPTGIPTLWKPPSSPDLSLTQEPQDRELVSASWLHGVSSSGGLLLPAVLWQPGASSTLPCSYRTLL